MKKDLVLLKDLEPRTTSLIISEQTGNSIDSVKRLIRTYKKQLEEFGVLGFEIRKPTEKGGRPFEEFYLNEEQLTFLIMTFRNNEKVIDFKMRITKEFFRMKKALSKLSEEKATQDYQLARKSGKQLLKYKTDVVKSFVEYAINQGSNGYKTESLAYSNIAKMENKALFIIEQKFPNVREVLNTQQLMIIATADQIVEKALLEGMEKEMNYKDIYQMAKERVLKFAELMPKTPVPMLERKMIK